MDHIVEGAKVSPTDGQQGRSGKKPSRRWIRSILHRRRFRTAGRGGFSRADISLPRRQPGAKMARPDIRPWPGPRIWARIGLFFGGLRGTFALMHRVLVETEMAGRAALSACY